LQTQTGTPYYASPEVWQDKPYDKSTAKDMKGLFTKVTKGVYPKIPAQYSSDLSGMISSLLQVDPKKRPSAE
jgi:NIMA (never in mitosis gene a)-related kinase